MFQQHKKKWNYGLICPRFQQAFWTSALCTLTHEKGKNKESVRFDHDQDKRLTAIDDSRMLWWTGWWVGNLDMRKLICKWYRFTGRKGGFQIFCFLFMCKPASYTWTASLSHHSSIPACAFQRFSVPTEDLTTRGR